MDICYASNEKYAPYLAASMVSCIRHNRDAESLRFHVIANGIGEACRKKLELSAERAAQQASGAAEKEQVSGQQIPERRGKDASLRHASEPQVSLRFYELSDLLQREFSGGEPDTGCYDISMLGRFFIGGLLPESVKTVLYLDCDTIVKGSLRPLFQRVQIPLVSGVQEPTIYPSIKRQLGLTGIRDAYINSGVLLIDLDAWRRQEIGEKLLSFYRRNAGRLFCGDQDAINYVLRGQIGLLSPRNNFFTNYYYFHYKTLVRMSPSYERLVPSSAHFRRIRQNPRILHYMGAERPWIRGNRNPFRRAFWEALSETEFAGLSPERGSALRMQAYHLMNLATWLCPGARRLLSAAYERRKVIPRLLPLVEENSRK